VKKMRGKVMSKKVFGNVWVVLLITLMFFLPVMIKADSIKLYPVRDTRLVDDTTELGNNANLIVGPYTSLLRFDLSYIPAGSTIIGTSALRAYYTFIAGDSAIVGNVGVWVMQKTWDLDEDGVLDTGEPTMTYQQSATASWEALFARGATDRGTIINTASVPGSGSAWIEWSISASIIQGWLDNPSTNYGFQLDGDGNAERKTFRSKEHTTTQQYPVLIVYYTPPTPPTSGTLLFYPTKDTMLVDDTTERGDDSRLIIGAFTSLLKFDLSLLPTEATVTNAVLRAYKTSVGGDNQTVTDGGVWVMQKLWDQDEDGVLDTGEPTKTYQQYDTVSPVSWESIFARGTTDRGDVIATASVDVGSSYQWVEWTIPASVIYSWRDNPSTNYGFQLDGYLNILRKTFRSRDWKEADLWPRLLVTYEPPSIEDWVIY